MNKQDRKDLERALALLAEAKEIIECVRDSEQEKFDNMPESLQYSEKGERFENNISSLDNAIDLFDCIEESIDEAIEN